MSRPDISVLLVTHNHAQFIERSLASIGTQITGFNIEVVVADDDSIDGTRELIVEWAAHAPFPVRVLDPEKRLGITRNYARGFTACRGRFIAILEGDDEWISVEKLEIQATALERNPDLTMVANRFLLFESDTGRATVNPLIGSDRFLTRVSSQRIAESNWFATFSTCMYRADAVARISPEIFESTSYDWIVALAVTEFGDAAILPEVTSLYRIHSGGAWSGASHVERARRLQSLIPNYMKLLEGRLDRQLSTMLTGLERLLRESPEPDEAPEVRRIAGIDEQPPQLAIPSVRDTRRPRVSVVMASYNHSGYVLEAVESVLGQTVDDLELVIVDDNSTDNSVSKLATLRDDRVRTYLLGENVGAAAALNIAIQQARGEFVAVINSDDTWELHKLARQLRAFEERPDIGAVFTGARFVDENGNALPSSRLPPWSEVFRQPNRSQGQWLRYFVGNGNALCHPSILIRREIYAAIGLYDNSLRQLPDLDRWIALVKHCPIEVLGDEPLVKFRTFMAHTNASSLSTENVIRTYHEHLVVNSRLFDDVTDQQLVEGFSDLMRMPHFRDPVEKACVVAFLWLDALGPMRELNRAQALTDIRALLRDDDAKLILKLSFGVDDKYLHLLAAHADGARTRDALHTIRDFKHTPEQIIVTRTVIPTGREILRAMRTTPLRHWPMKIRRRLGGSG